jgi:hypothetical protein
MKQQVTSAPANSPISSVMFCNKHHNPMGFTQFTKPVPQDKINYHGLCTENFSYALAIMADGRTIKYVNK